MGRVIGAERMGVELVLIEATEVAIIIAVRLPHRVIGEIIILILIILILMLTGVLIVILILILTGERIITLMLTEGVIGVIEVPQAICHLIIRAIMAITLVMCTPR